MTLSGTTVRSALAAVGAVGKQLRTFDELAAGADGALRQAPPGLTVQGAAAFLATLTQESAYLRTTTEYGSGQWYAPWIGRTFEQLTHEEAYRDFGAWCKTKGLVADPDIFVKDRAALSDYRWAWLGGVWYFQDKGLWGWANAGDFRRVSQAVNGGLGKVGTTFTPNGWDDRQEMYAAYLAAGSALLPAGTTPPTSSTASGCQYGARDDPATRTWQQWLRDNFAAYAGNLVVDGDYGPATKAATAEFQRRVNITGPDADGSVVGPRTLTAARQLGFRG